MYIYGTVNPYYERNFKDEKNIISLATDSMVDWQTYMCVESTFT